MMLMPPNKPLLGPLPDDSFAALICLESSMRNDFEISKTSLMMRYMMCFQSACSFSLSCCSFYIREK